MSAPHDLQAERATLGACISSSQELARILAILEPVDFYSDLHRMVYAAIRAAAAEHQNVDHVLVGKYATSDAREFLLDLYSSVPTAANGHLYAGRVKKAAEARKVLDFADRVREKALSAEYEDSASFALAKLEEIVNDDLDGGALSYAESLEEFDALLARRKENAGITGIRTGITKMDSGLGGLNGGCSYIIAARPGVGKSLVAAQIAQTAANQGCRVLLQTPEMGRVQYLDRLAHAIAGVDYDRGFEGRLTDYEVEKVRGAARTMAKLPVYIDDYGTQTAARVRANVMRHKPDLLIVDYLQYMAPEIPSPSRNQEVGGISRSLTRIKSDFDIPVVLCAQLNRAVESRHDKRPNLSDLRDSGEIEQDADAVIFLHRAARWDDSAPEDEIELHCEKWRFGGLWQTTAYLAPGANWVINNRGDAA